MSEPTQELRVLAACRKTLARVVRELTPAPGAPRLLSDDAVRDIRMCFELIAARERELHDGRRPPARPRHGAAACGKDDAR